MNEKISFSAQYKHPLWQKKRLEALENAGFSCQRCYDQESTLHVHHKRYVKGRMLWEYTDLELEALCESCHEEAHAEKELLNQILVSIPSEGVGAIASIVAGYCSHASGPAGACSDLTDIRDTLSSHHLDAIGAIAAMIERRYEKLPALHKMIDDLSNADRNSKVTLIFHEREDQSLKGGF